MASRSNLGEAIALAAEVHKDQYDKAGVAYILHPLAVMERARTYYLAQSDGWQLDKVLVTAVLHDALEDVERVYGWTHSRLADRIYVSFGGEVSAAVEALTKRPRGEETYDEYLERVSRNWIARIVKIADLSHNLDAFRMPSGKIGERDFERWDKYHRALVQLTAVETAGQR